MKEAGPIIVTVIVILSVMFMLHKQGQLFTNTLETQRSNTSAQQKNNSGNNGEEIRGANSGAHGYSPYSQYVSIYDVENPESVASNEYVIIQSAGNSTPINITGWSLVSEVTGSKAYIGKASPLPQIQPEKNIELGPYEQVIISSGHSPTGISFRTNLCTGYFEDQTNFIPSLSLRCPEVPEDDLPDSISDSENCTNYIDSLSICEIPRNQLPTMSSKCENFIRDTFSYNGCVNQYKNRSDFYRSEWRVFLKSNPVLWKEKGDVIKLLDAQGELVDSFKI